MTMLILFNKTVNTSVTSFLPFIFTYMYAFMVNKRKMSFFLVKVYMATLNYSKLHTSITNVE